MTATETVSFVVASPEPAFVPGLAGVVAAQTRLSAVDGARGELVIAGYPVEEIAGRASFEEMVYLLWRDRLPNAQELAGLHSALAARRALAPLTLEVLAAAAARRAPAMDALRMAAGTLWPEPAGEVACGDIPAGDLAVLAALPSIVAAYARLWRGEAPLAPQAGLGHAANYLYMLSGVAPAAEQVRALETYFNTVVDHGLNASTFAARVIISTRSDLVSAVVGALGALKGPLHGGAPAPALDLVFEIGMAEQAEAYLRARLDRKERLMGFGHRVYRTRDPRTEVLAAAAERLYRTAGDTALYDLAKQVERAAVRLLAEYHPERRLETNVEFYTALLLHGLGLPQELFTPTFAISRAAGWIAHCQEQRRADHLIRPQSSYIGPHGRRWAPVAER